ncbi:MAG: serine/threonine-protein kinase [Acidobacteriota bacterium]
MSTRPPHDDDRPVDPTAPTTAPPESLTPGDGPSLADVPEAIGRYKVLRLLGKGGMGRVYLAEQSAPQREVALKVMSSHEASPSEQARFDLETRLLARLEHEGIARIFDAGRIDIGDGPQAFFAMERVDGLPLDEHARRAELDWRERVRLWIEVAEAVAHAHRRGVIHRDLKPANILVNKDGRPKVLDFGIARAADAENRVTEAGESAITGTLAYMSPEQLRGDPDGVDTRADVHALGILGYELLSGRRPHDLTDLTVGEAIGVLLEQPPRPLDEVTSDLPSDLVLVVHAALEKDRELRTPSAESLADDLRAVLEHRPVSARAPSRWYLASKFIRRHAPAVVASAAAVLALVGGIVSATAEERRARRAEQVALEAEAEADDARRDAETQAERVQAINDFLVNDLLESASPENSLGREVTVLEALDESARRANSALADQPELRLSVLTTLGGLYASLAEHEKADEQLTAAQGLVEELGLEETEEGLVVARHHALLLKSTGKSDEAEELARRNLEISLRALGSQHEMTGGCHMDLGTVLAGKAQWEESEASNRRALPILQARLGSHHGDTLLCRQNIAIVVGHLGRNDEARELLTDLVGALTEASGALHPDTLLAKNNLAIQLVDTDRMEEAEALLQEVLPEAAEVLGTRHRLYLRFRATWTHFLLESKRAEEAESYIRQTLLVQEELLGREHVHTLRTLDQLAYVLDDLGRRDESVALSRETLARWESREGVGSHRALVAGNNLAMTLLAQSKLPEAEQEMGRTARLAAENLPEGHPHTAIFQSNHGDMLRQLGRLDEAEPVLRRSLTTLHGTFGEGHARTLNTAERLAMVLRELGRTDEADELVPPEPPPGG